MIYVFGASDDLIELRGDIEEEVPSSYKEDNYLLFSNGVAVKISYDGEWRINIIRNPDQSVNVIPVSDIRGRTDEFSIDINDYTDLAKINTQSVSWVGHAKELILNE